MTPRLWIWLLVPFAAVLLIAGWAWVGAQHRSKASEAEHARTRALLAEEGQARGAIEYSLEVVGLGASLDRHRQGMLWEALKSGHPYASIRPQGPKAYPWSEQEKADIEGGSASSAMENGANDLPLYVVLPTFRADSEVLASATSATSPAGTIVDTHYGSMSFQLYIDTDWELSERPDRLLGRVFAFYEKHPEAPLSILNAADGLYLRDRFRPAGSPPLIRDGYYVPEMPGSAAVFSLARRERVDAIRPYAFEDYDESQPSAPDLNERGYARRLYLAYLALTKRVPRGKDELWRQPTLLEWTAEAATFARRDDIYHRKYSMFHADLLGRSPPLDYPPTPLLPLPWNKDQLADFDRLPNYGALHRPVYVPMLDEQGRPLTRREARAAALAAGLREALRTLPESQRKLAPARVLFSTGGNVDQVILLDDVLRAWAAEGGPELDRRDPTQWIDTDARLGNTGAATWFMQIAIGLMGSYRAGGASLAVNLRDPAEASLVFVTPPPDEQRKTQRHPRGGDPLRNAATPAIDPEAYR